MSQVRHAMDTASSSDEAFRGPGPDHLSHLSTGPQAIEKAEMSPLRAACFGRRFDLRPPIAEPTSALRPLCTESCSVGHVLAVVHLRAVTALASARTRLTSALAGPLAAKVVLTSTLDGPTSAVVDTPLSARQTARSDGGHLPQRTRKSLSRAALFSQQVGASLSRTRDLPQRWWCTASARVVTFRCEVARHFRTGGQTACYQELAVHHLRCGRSSASESRSGVCCRQVHRVLK